MNPLKNGLIWTQNFNYILAFYQITFKLENITPQNQILDLNMTWNINLTVFKDLATIWVWLLETFHLFVHERQEYNNVRSAWFYTLNLVKKILKIDFLLYLQGDSHNLLFLPYVNGIYTFAKLRLFKFHKNDDR